MKTCRNIRKNGVAYLSGELDGKTSERLSSHLQGCPDCREDIERMKKIIDAARPLKDELEETLRSVDWDALPQRITRAVFDKRLHPDRAGGFGLFRNPFARTRMTLAFAGLILGLILGSAATYLVLKRPLVPLTRTADFFASADFLDRVELAMARRETLDYLEKSRYLLLDFVRIDPAGFVDGPQFPDSPMIRELLAKKKYLNTQLGHSRMVQAKAICDQIEMLFLELAQIRDDLPATELKRIQDMIEERQLLLMINLVKHDLEREV